LPLYWVKPPGQAKLIGAMGIFFGGGQIERISGITVPEDGFPQLNERVVATHSIG